MRIKPRLRQGRDHADSVSDFQYPYDELLLDARLPVNAQQADCCVARAAYRIVLPAGQSRPRPTELLLCGHHFRASQDSLCRAGATAFDAQHHLCSVAA